jgi:adenylosuccinate lyase
LPRLAWDNAALNLLERTLDDSANRRILLPEACLAAEELLRTARRLLSGLQIDQAAIARNLAKFAPFAAIERLLMALAKAGADRQLMHELLRQHALRAWDALRQDQPNPLPHTLVGDPALLQVLSPAEIQASLDSAHHLGDAPQRACQLAETIRLALA